MQVIFGNFAVHGNIIEANLITKISLGEINTRGDSFFDIDHGTPPLNGYGA
jgi:hypothetical protein